MSGSAVLMMIVTLAVIWGGLVVAILMSMRSARGTDPHPHRDL